VKRVHRLRPPLKKPPGAAVISNNRVSVVWKKLFVRSQ
jgi:hypothetical protein